MGAHQDWIELDNIALEVIVGILDFERVTPQPVIVDLKLYLDLDRCGDSGDLGQSIDYAAVLDQVTMMAEEGRWRLIESMALGICRLFLAKPAEGEARSRIDRVDIRVRKPKILGGIAVPGVAMSRDANACLMERIHLTDGVDAECLVQPDRGGAWRVHIEAERSWELPQKCAAHVIAGDFEGLSTGARIRGGRMLTNRGSEVGSLLVLGRLA